MTGKIFYLPVRSHERTSDEDLRLNAATDWLLSELNEPVSIKALRALAAKELARPRDDLHRRWAKLFLEETVEYVD